VDLISCGDVGGFALLLCDSLRRAGELLQWQKATDNGVEIHIRGKEAYLEMLKKFPFDEASKQRVLNETTENEWELIVSGKLIDVFDDKPAISTMLKNRFGPNTKTSVRINTDPTGKEFDGVTDDLYIEHKESMGNITSGDKKHQLKYQFKACQLAGKDNLLLFDRNQNQGYIDKIIQYADDFKVNVKVEMAGVEILNINKY